MTIGHARSFGGAAETRSKLCKSRERESVIDFVCTKAQLIDGTCVLIGSRSFARADQNITNIIVRFGSEFLAGAGFGVEGGAPKNGGHNSVVS